MLARDTRIVLPKFALAVLALALLALTACSYAGATGQPATTSSAPEATPAASNAAVASAARDVATGIPSVDNAVAAVAAKDAAALAGSLHFWGRGCMQQVGANAVPCPAKAPAGTAVPVIGSSACDGVTFFQAGDPALKATIQAFLTRATGLHSVLKAPPFRGEPDIPGAYVLIFDSGVALSVDETGVTFLIFGCEQTTAAALIATHRFGGNPHVVFGP